MIVKGYIVYLKNVVFGVTYDRNVLYGVSYDYWTMRRLEWLMIVMSCTTIEKYGVWVFDSVVFAIVLKSVALSQYLVCCWNIKTMWSPRGSKEFPKQDRLESFSRQPDCSGSPNSPAHLWGVSHNLYHYPHCITTLISIILLACRLQSRAGCR